MFFLNSTTNQQQFLKFRFDEISYNKIETEIPLPGTFLKIRDEFLESIY